MTNKTKQHKKTPVKNNYLQLGLWVKLHPIYNSKNKKKTPSKEPGQMQVTHYKQQQANNNNS